MEQAVNACRQLDPAQRPTALDICTLIEASAPRHSLSSDEASMHPGARPSSSAGLAVGRAAALLVYSLANTCRQSTR